MLGQIGRLDLLVVDDFCVAPMTDGERRDFLEICDTRFQARSVLLTSQLPVANWHPQIGDPTLADSILDRLVHNAHRIELKGDRMRVTCDGKPAGELQSPGLAHETKSSFHFTVNGPGVLFDDVRIWRVR